MLIFLINLDRDQDRLSRMSGEAARVGIPFKRFPAMEGHRLEPPLRAQFFAGDVMHERALIPGEVGCYASHLLVNQLLLDSETDDCALVIEDDVCLADDLPSVIDAVRRLDRRWDIIRLSNRPKAVVLPVADLGGGRELVRFWTVPNGTGAYLMSKAGAAKFAAVHRKRTLPVDEEMRRPWRLDLDTFGVVPPPVEGDERSRSTIDPVGNNRCLAARSRFKDAAQHRDFLPLLRYRLATFGPVGCCRALARSAAMSLMRRIHGRSKVQQMCRLKWRAEPARAP